MRLRADKSKIRDAPAPWRKVNPKTVVPAAAGGGAVASGSGADNGKE
jgi:hypothetical protein